MKNKQDWEEELKKLMGYEEVVGEYRTYDWIPYNDMKKFIQKQLTKAKEEAVKEVLSLPKQDYKPVFGLSNRKFIFVNSIELYLKSLEDKK